MCLGTATGLFGTEEFLRYASDTHGDATNTESRAEYRATDAAADTCSPALINTGFRQRRVQYFKQFDSTAATSKSRSTDPSERESGERSGGYQQRRTGSATTT